MMIYFLLHVKFTVYPPQKEAKSLLHEMYHSKLQKKLQLW